MPSMYPEGFEFSSLWVESAQPYLWPEEARGALPDEEPQFDRPRLLALAGGRAAAQPFVLTFLTEELFPLGLLWARFALRAGVTRFAIAAMDASTADRLERAGIPAFEVHLPGRIARMADYRNHGGFYGKALALIYSRGWLVRYLVGNGIDVIASDADALFDRLPGPDHFGDKTIAFQRVAYLPKPLSRIWGFSGCCGFVLYRSHSSVLDLLSRAHEIQRWVSSDQVAFNLALLEHGVVWDAPPHNFETQDEVVREFGGNAHAVIDGILPGTSLSLRALPATSFWRHEFVPLDRSVTVILHPNSPKPLPGKLEVFRRLLHTDELDGLDLELQE